MTTAQIIILSTVGILSIIGYFGSGLSKSNSNRSLYLFLLMFTTALFALVACLMTSQVEELRKQVKEKCPEYEKIENVYKLKN